MDGGKTSYDRPPSSPPPSPDPGPGRSADSVPAPAREPSASVEPPVAPVPTPEPSASAEPLPPPTSAPEPSMSAEPPLPPSIKSGPIPTPSPPSTPAATGPPTGRRVDVSASASTPDAVGRPATVAPGQHRPAVPPVGVDAAYQSSMAERAELEHQRALSRPRRTAYIVVFAALVLSLVGLAYVHLRPSGGGPSARAGAGKTTSPSSSPTRSSVPVTTTTALPTALSPSADAAATALVSSWSTGNKAAALTVATPAAVNTLFAAPYTSGLAIARGCSTEFSPIVCTYGPPGGASPSDAIYQVLVSQTAGGWYVSSVRVQG
jgi:hypothetical protein